MKKDNDYFKLQEKICHERFTRWQEQTNFFEEHQRMPKYHWSDESGTTNNIPCNVESKNRNQVLCKSGKVSGLSKTDSVYKADTLIVESHKVADLLLDWINNGFEPLYFNYLENDVTIVFNLRKMGHPKKKRFNNITSTGYGTGEADYRFELPLKDADIYKAGKLVKKAGEEWDYEGMCEC